MKGLNDKSNSHFMRLIDQMAGQSELRIFKDGRQPLTVTLIATDIFTNSHNTVGNLYNLSISDSPDGSTQNPGMKFLIIDRRNEVSIKDPVQIFPVSYRQDAHNIASEGVIIFDKHVHEVNHKWQHEYARSANQWIKTMAQMGYFKERVQLSEDGLSIVCNCGNSTDFEGFDYCDEVGNVIEAFDVNRTTVICHHCKRVIDKNTLQVITLHNTVQNLKLPNISFDIYKPIVVMTTADKAKLLHVLCPDIIRAFLAYVNDSAQAVINGSEVSIQSTYSESFPVPVWKALAKNVSQIIATSMNRLANESDLFAKELFTGFNNTFLLHCIQQYMVDCQNTRVVRGIEFIFDL